MIDFAAVLYLYTRGKAKFAQVDQTLDKLLSTHPENAEDYLDALHKVHAIQPLPAKAFNAFNSKLTDTIRRRTVANDASAQAPLDFEFAEDGTVYSAAAKRARRTAPADATEATVLRTRKRRKKPTPAATRSGPDVPGEARPAPPQPATTTQSVAPGTVIKDRFELVELLGQGGMGLVYKAKDRLKVEAQDRNPFVAVKLLTEDFRQYAESFIALQREASKAQRLAHPNIGTVFDFDRDGDLIYMTMELLEGQELKEFINELPFGGLSVEDALPIIEGLGNALSYAHENGLIHSDFKPGNAFVTSGGGIKVIDFGIARASKARAVHGDTTVFDPGSLGGITPAYATPEMFEGLDPHPSDDIYALACISYELLTGKHPYNRVAAPKAKEQGLQPAPIKKLNGRQQKGLFKALAFDRKDRTHDIGEFLNDIRPHKSYAIPIAIGTLAASVLLGVLLYNPIQNYFLEQEYQLIIANIREGSPNTIALSLAQIRGLEPKAQQAITNATRDELLKYYEDKIGAALSETDGFYDFARADVLLAQAGEYYKDSARLSEIASSVKQREQKLLNDLKTRIAAHIKSGALLPDKNRDDVTDVLTTLEKTFPSDPLRTDPELIQAYKTQINRAVGKQDYETAAQLLAVSATFKLTDTRLQQLEDRVTATLQARRRDQQAQLAEQRLRTALPSFRLLKAYEQYLPDIAALRANAPETKLLRDIDDGLEKRFLAAHQRYITKRDWSNAEILLQNYALALRFDFLQAQRAALSAAERSAGTLPQPRAAFVAQLQALEDLGTTGALDAAWHTSVQEAYRKAVALAPEDSSALAAVTARLVNIYLEGTASALGQNRHARADSILAEGLRAFPQQTALVAEQQRLLEQQRVAEIDEYKQTLLDHAQADDVDAARQALAALKQRLPADDVLITTTGPQAIGDAYVRLAAGKQHQQAVSLLQAGLAIAPNYTPLREALGSYTLAQDTQEVRNLIVQAQLLDVANLRQRLNGLRNNSPDDYGAIEDELAMLLAKRIRGLERTNLRQAHALLDQGRALFPGNGRIAQVNLKELPKPSVLASRGLAEAEAGRLTAASAIYEQAQTREPDHVDTQQLATQLQSKKAQADQLYRQATSAINSARYNEAQSLLDQAIAGWNDNPQYQDQRDKLQALASKRAAGARPCQQSFAGLGRNARATCQDVVGKRQKGPQLVVIPAGGAVGQSFAISKYEVTESEFNAYCKSTGKCTPGGRNGRSPKVLVDVAAAEAYASWLSAESGFEYRLPTHAEWLHAAKAGDREGNSEYNCQLKLSGKLVKGLTILNATSGKPNAWGLVNYVGNVQEFVRTAPGNVSVAGGSYKDAMSKCSTGLNRSHPGNADPVTGFRVVRSLG